MVVRVARAAGTAIVISLLLIFFQEWWGTYKNKQFQQIVTQAIIKPTKVFQIGFSKCGTSTIAYFFNRNGVPAMHHDFGKLPVSIHHNYLAGKPLISPRYEKVLVFTDMELLYKKPVINVPVQYFKELDKQYPGSKFILNTRNKSAWLKSRSKQPVGPDNESLLIVSARLQNITPQEMEQRWSQEWDEHHAAVKEYFKDRPNDLLIFDIEKDKPQKLVDFFKDDFRLDPSIYTAKNQTTYREISTLWDKYFSSNKW